VASTPAWENLLRGLVESKLLIKIRLRRSISNRSRLESFEKASWDELFWIKMGL